MILDFVAKDGQSRHYITLNPIVKKQLVSQDKFDKLYEELDSLLEFGEWRDDFKRRKISQLYTGELVDETESRPDRPNLEVVPELIPAMYRLLDEKLFSLHPSVVQASATPWLRVDGDGGGSGGGAGGDGGGGGGGVDGANSAEK
eukprot:TRINITY_DN926_c7_g1_i1.p2 TRINITY_DN926_c7_g1~~TRINITY_DN926_c7_g1_i1.p2  ORF type:complete len:145 (+),score=65.24 TRINITY_DN926_c7_g1_i1:202-636(+)